jgi:hypothetical protein
VAAEVSPEHAQNGGVSAQETRPDGSQAVTAQPGAQPAVERRETPAAGFRTRRAHRARITTLAAVGPAGTQSALDAAPVPDATTTARKETPK